VSQKLLFIFGTARSGTTALCNLLNEDPRTCLGMERYSAISQTSRFTPELFEEQRFFDMQPGDTWYARLDHFAEHYAALKPKYRQAGFRGDKIPRLARRLDYLLRTFPSARLLITVRDIFDVAASYEVRADEGLAWPQNRRTMDAIQDWNLMLKNSLAHADESRIHWVMYEEFFTNRTGLEDLYAFLGMTPSPGIDAAFASMLIESRERARQKAGNPGSFGEAERALIKQHARFDLYDRLRIRVKKRAVRKSSSFTSRMHSLLPVTGA